MHCSSNRKIYTTWKVDGATPMYFMKPPFGSCAIFFHYSVQFCRPRSVPFFASWWWKTSPDSNKLNTRLPWSLLSGQISSGHLRLGEHPRWTPSSCISGPTRQRWVVEVSRIFGLSMFAATGSLWTLTNHTVWRNLVLNRFDLWNCSKSEDIDLIISSHISGSKHSVILWHSINHIIWFHNSPITCFEWIWTMESSKDLARQSPLGCLH